MKIRKEVNLIFELVVGVKKSILIVPSVVVLLII